VLKDDQEVINEGRRNPLKDSEDLQVTVPLREQIIDKLVKRLEEDGEGLRTLEIWQQGNNDRQAWLTRRTTLLGEYDEFISPIYQPSQAWSSTLHLPIALTQAKTFHARFLAALIGVDPPFTVKARKGANQDRAMLVQELMRYTLSSWTNNYKGIEEAVDAWLWEWVTGGSSILKARWDRRFTRFLDVVKKTEQVGVQTALDEAGNLQMTPEYAEIEVEEAVTREVFNGPCVEWVPIEDVLIVGGNGDPEDADHVIQQQYLTASQLWTLADTGVFRKSAVEKVIEAGDSYQAGEQVNEIKMLKKAVAGLGDLDKNYDQERYQILERYTRVDVDGSGIVADVILWVAGETGDILRATYLWRVMPTGLRPFFKIDFHKRHGEDYGVGLIELLYSLTKEIDAIHNMKIDFGLLTSMPFGFYRATSSISQERMPMEPGVMIPLDNPQTDVFFPQLGTRTAFNEREEMLLQQQIERLTSISDLSLGIVGGQGATRTATGTRALLGESNANLDVFLKRMNRGWKRVLIYMFHMLQEKLPPGFQFRILGDDGNAYWQTVETPQELQGLYDFEIEANSANSNKAVQIEQANSILMTIANPLFIQLGIVTPEELFQAIKYKFQVEGVRDFARFIRKPAGPVRVYAPIEIANAILAGIDIKMGPEQDLQGFIEWWEDAKATVEILGQFQTEQVVKLESKAREAAAMMEAVQAQQGQVANASQVQQNAAMATGAPEAQPMGVQQGGGMPPPEGAM
jgi:hypothetical protein